MTRFPTPDELRVHGLKAKITGPTDGTAKELSEAMENVARSVSKKIEKLVKGLMSATTLVKMSDNDGIEARTEALVTISCILQIVEYIMMKEMKKYVAQAVDCEFYERADNLALKMMGEILQAKMREIDVEGMRSAYLLALGELNLAEVDNVSSP